MNKKLCNIGKLFLEGWLEEGIIEKLYRKNAVTVPLVEILANNIILIQKLEERKNG